MRIIVCGGREFDNKDFVYSVLDTVHATLEITHLWHGNARGADSLAEYWASERKIPFTAVKAEWQKYGNRAGPIRNQEMLDQAQPDLLVAFPGGRGTADMVNRARTAGVHILQFWGVSVC